MPSFKFLDYIHDAFKQKESNVLSWKPSGSVMVGDFKKMVLSAKHKNKIFWTTGKQNKTKTNGGTVSLWPEAALCEMPSYGVTSAEHLGPARVLLYEAPGNCSIRPRAHPAKTGLPPANPIISFWLVFISYTWLFVATLSSHLTWWAQILWVL